MKDIRFRDAFAIIFFKPLWLPDEIFLARCLEYEIAGKEIIVDLRTATRKSVYEFMKIAFPQRMTAPIAADYRKELFAQLKTRYDNIHDDFKNTLLKKVPYSDILRWYQTDALLNSAYKRFTFWALDMGLGKSISAFTVSYMLQVPRTIIVCPAAVKWSLFRDMTENWGYNPLYFTILDAQKNRSMVSMNERFVIINYDILPKYMDYLTKEKVGHIVLDEVHRCKSIATRRFKNVHHLIEAHPSARVTMLSGTPIRNRVNDLFAPLKLAGHPLGKNYAYFLREFTTGTKVSGREVIKGAKNLNRLFVMLSNFIIRRTKEECLKDLPDLVINKYIIRDAEYLEEYNKIIEEMINGEHGDSTLNGSLASLNILVSKAKIRAKPGIMNLIDEIIDQGRKVVVFSGYNAPLTMLQEHYKEKCVRIDGSVNSSKRDGIITAFKNDDSIPIFLGQIDAAGEGIDLTVASDVIICDFPFTPSQLDQALSRCHRSRQKNSVNAYYCIAEGSIDEMLFKLISGKATDITAAIDRDKPTLSYEDIGTKLFNELITNYKKTH